MANTGLIIGFKPKRRTLGCNRGIVDLAPVSGLPTLRCAAAVHIA